MHVVRTGHTWIDPEMENLQPEHSKEKIWPVVVFVATVLVLVCLIIKMFLVEDVSTALVTAIAAISGLLIVSPRLFDFAELSISKDGLVAKIDKVEKKAELVEQVAKSTERKIDQIFANTMSESMYSNLKKLATGSFGQFQNSGGLRRELQHLRDVGYIHMNRHIGELPIDGNNLSDYVTVTPVGKDFVDLREALEADTSPKIDG